MKLNELFDTVEKERPTDFKKVRPTYKYNEPVWDEDAHELKREKPKNFLGAGVYSVARNKTSDPHLIVKNPHTASYDLGEDAAYAYAKMIVDEKIAQENPYAPRIYKITLFKGTDESQKYKLDMEKLFPSESLTPEECRVIYSQIMGTEIDFVSPSGIARGILEKYLRGGNVDIQDENCRSLLDRIKELSESQKFEFDIHSGNFMVRRGRGIPQIVITDPLT